MMNEQVLKQLENDIKLRGMSVKTMEEYVKHANLFLR